MNLFFLVAFASFAAVLAGVLMAVLTGKEMTVHFRAFRRRISVGLEPLANRARLEKSARRLNHAVLHFDAA